MAFALKEKVGRNSVIIDEEFLQTKEHLQIQGEMEAFDHLPRAMRDFLNEHEAGAIFSPKQVGLLCRGDWPIEKVIAFLKHKVDIYYKKPYSLL